MSTHRDDEKRDVRLNIRVEPEFLDRLKEAARSEGIPVASFVKRTLTLALRQHASQAQASAAGATSDKATSS